MERGAQFSTLDESPSGVLTSAALKDYGGGVGKDIRGISVQYKEDTTAHGTPHTEGK